MSLKYFYFGQCNGILLRSSNTTPKLIYIINIAIAKILTVFLQKVKLDEFWQFDTIAHGLYRGL